MRSLVVIVPLLLGGCDLLFQIDKLKEQQPDAGLVNDQADAAATTADASIDGQKAGNCVEEGFVTLAAQWTTFATPPMTSVAVDGTLSITLNGAAHVHGGVDNPFRDYTGASVEVDVLSVPDAASETYIDWTRGDDWYSIAVDHNELSYGYSFGNQSNTIEIPYDAAKHRGFKMAHDPESNTIRMSVRNTLGEWTLLGTIPVTLPVTSLQVELAAGSYTQTASTGVARFDNFVTCF
jgi:hypothetical protein